VTVTYSRTAGETVAGSPYTISAALSPAGVLGNYNITYNTASFTINKATASVTPNAASKVYGAVDPVFTGTLSGFLAGDGVTAAYTRAAGETVAGSPYTISATLSPAAVLGNYNITYNTASFTINKATASVTPNAASKTYGAVDPAFTGTLTGFLAADGVTATYTRTAGQTVAGSPYTISASLSPAAVLGNYNITYNTASFTISKATASVTPNAASKTYGTADPAFTGTLTGFLAADGVTATYTRTAGQTVAGSPYIISATLSPAAVLGNYNITYNTANFTIQPANQSALILTTTSPLTYDQSEPLSVTGGSTGGAVTYKVTGVACAITGALLNQLTATSGTGSCTVTATMAGNGNYNPVTSTPANTVNLALASQTITFTTNAPASAAYNTSFTVAATGGASGNAVTFTNSGVCRNIGAIYTMTNSTGTCSVIANQAGNTNYSAAPQVSQTVNANGPLLSVTPSSVNLGIVNFDLDLNAPTITVKNIGTATATISNVSLTLGSGTNTIDFTLVNLCPSTLAPGKTCYISVLFFSGNLGPVSATLKITDNTPGSPQQVTLSAIVVGFNPSSLNFGTIKVGKSSTQSVMLSNTGTTALTIGSISVTGTNAHDFVKSSACPSSLAPNTSCTVSVTFTPSATGSRSANLTLSDNAALGTLIAPLSGKGD
jgi:hypothetical protein